MDDCLGWALDSCSSQTPGDRGVHVRAVGEWCRGHRTGELGARVGTPIAPGFRIVHCDELRIVFMLLVVLKTVCSHFIEALILARASLDVAMVMLFTSTVYGLDMPCPVMRSATGDVAIGEGAHISSVRLASQGRESTSWKAA